MQRWRLHQLEPHLLILRKRIVLSFILVIVQLRPFLVDQARLLQGTGEVYSPFRQVN